MKTQSRGGGSLTLAQVEVTLLQEKFGVKVSGMFLSHSGQWPTMTNKLKTSYIYSVRMAETSIDRVDTPVPVPSPNSGIDSGSGYFGMRRQNDLICRQSLTHLHIAALVQMQKGLASSGTHLVPVATAALSVANGRTEIPASIVQLPVTDRDSRSNVHVGR